jgi:hypothetical protein
MKYAKHAMVLSALAVGGVVGALATAQQDKHTKMPEMKMPADFKLPKGWTPEDMQKCMMAGMPGTEHEHLAHGAGTWHGKTTMWMGPGSEAMHSDTTAVTKMVMDGRFAQTTVSGDMPGMGPFNGMATLGYDNVSKEYVCTWIDNHGTGIMHGTGTMSPDHKTMTINYNFNCPVTGKNAVMREVDTFVSENEFTMEMFMNDPKTGEEYKMMRVEYTRKM